MSENSPNSIPSTARVLRSGFTLIEMLVVIGIITVLVGISIGGFSKMTKSAERQKAQELVSNVSTALTQIFNKEGAWPQRLLQGGESGGRLDQSSAYALAKAKVMALSVNGKQLDGLDKFGVVTPWATTAIKRAGTSASLSTKVGSYTVQEHILYYAIDVDGDGLIAGVNVGGETLTIRATAAVWSIGKSGGDQGQPWPYTTGLRHDDVYSWTRAQVQNK